ncbi:MAG: hypothetical protein ACYC0X_20980 [Pirellulaceae bacterium]
MFYRATILLVLLLIGALHGPGLGDETAVPATALISDDAILVVRVNQPKALIDRAFDQRVVQFVQSLPPYKEAMAQAETQQVLTMVNFFESKYGADLPALLGKLVGGGVTLAAGPGDSALLIVDAEDAQMLEEIHDFFRTIAKGEASKQSDPDRVASAEYRGVMGWKFGPGESHAIIGNRLLLSNRPETLKAAIDRQLDHSGQDLTKSSHYQRAVAALKNEAQVTLFANMAVLKQLPGFAQGLTQDDNPLTRLLFAPFLAAIHEASWLAASADLTAESLAINLVADRTSPEPTTLNSFALPLNEGQGAMPNLVVPGQIAALSMYRDLHQFYAAKDELFPDRTSGLIFFENMMGIFFSGKDLTNEVLAQTLPDIRFVVAEQRYDEKTGTPAMKLPGFALVIQLRDQEKFALVMKEAWQKAIGLVNFTRGQKAQPGLIIDSASHNGTTYTTSYFSVADEENKEAVDIRFNFQPALAVAGDRLIMSSSDLLARDLIDAIKLQQTEGVAPVSGQHSLVTLKSGPLASVLDSNREMLIRQNMVEDGKSREAAEQEVAGLFLVMKYLTELQFAAGTGADRSEVSIKLNYELPQ